MLNQDLILFTVIIPTFNRKIKLINSLNSVLKQSYKNFEVIIIDDGSTDGTNNYILSLKDSRIKYIWQNNSGGPARPRNIGIKNAKGDWISFLDADDIWYEDKLSKVAEIIMNNKNIDVICHNEFLNLRNQGLKKVLKYGPVTLNFYKTLLIYGNRLSTSATTVKKIFLTNNVIEFNERHSFIAVEDYDFWLKIAFKNGNFKFINNILGEYIVDEESISQQYEKHYCNELNLLNYHVFFVQEFNKNKIRLWKKMKVNVELNYLYKNKTNIEYRIIKLFFIFLKNPLLSNFFLINKIVRKIHINLFFKIF